MSNYRDYITEEERNIFANWLYEYGNGTESGIEVNLNEWYHGKSEHLLKLFGGQTIVTEEVSLVTDTREIVEQAENAMTELGIFFLKSETTQALKKTERYVFIQSFKDGDKKYYKRFYENSPLPIGNICDELYKTLALDVYMVEIDTSKFTASDILHWRHYSEEEIKNFGKIVFKAEKGTKLARYINKKVIPFFETIPEVITPEVLERVKVAFKALTLELSMINQKYVNNKGTLCLSIHPMDYVTMSDNSYDWCSCMSWMEEGEYRRGTLECMTSPMVVIAYIKGSSKFSGWNNKKWRELFVVTEEGILGIKGYPYHNAELETYIMEKLRKMAKDTLGWEYRDQEQQAAGFVHPNSEHRNGWMLHFNTMYNDAYRNQPIYFSTNLKEKDNVEFDASGDAFSVYSGELIDTEAPAELLITPIEAGYERCPSCGAWVREDEIYDDEIDDDGNPVTYCECCC